jgi:tetratricopeptide (TPR) repeat protein
VHGGTDDSSERWIADPFVHIDDMGRPYVLTRLRNEEGLWEYTRFLAQVNSIIEINDPQIFESFRRPSPEEYSAPETEVKDQLEYVRSGDLPDIQALRTEGLTALRRGDYDATIQTFSQIVELRPALHVVWLQLGHARRNKAWDLVHSGEFGAAREQARKAIESYEKASRHSSLSHRASAVYSISKTAWMLYKYLSDSSYELDDIIKLARDAHELYPEDKHHTWIEFLESYGGPNAASG